MPSMYPQMNDPRRVKLKAGLAQLTNAELRRVLDRPAEMVYDGFNFDPATGRW